MTEVPKITDVKVTSDNDYNGNVASYTVTVTPAFYMVSTDVFYITFPAEVSVSITSACSVGTMLSSVTCTQPAANQLKVTLTFSSSPLPAGSSFSFKVSKVTNAGSTKPTSVFSGIEAFDSSNNKIGTFSGTAPLITNRSPASATGTLTQQDQGVGVPNIYTIAYTTFNSLPVGSTFQIGYPTIVSAPATLTTCTVTV